MNNKLVIELGIDKLQYNLYDVVIRNLKEHLGIIFTEENIIFDEYKINFSKNRIVIFIIFSGKELDIENVKEIIVKAINRTIIPIKNLPLSNELKDYIIWIQGMLNKKYFSFNEFILTKEDKEKFSFLKINDIENYRLSLEHYNIILEKESRKKYFINSINRLVKENGLVIYNSSYIIEKYINEFNLPYPIIKSIDNRYLEYPKELLTTIMLDICNIIPVKNDKNILMPYFIFCVEKENQSNSELIDSIYNQKLNEIDHILLKYEAAMNYNYEYYLTKMKNTASLKKIGTLYDETIRLKELTKILGGYLNVGEDTLVNLEIESEICKMDLATEVVEEMSELKGVIGYLYAKKKNFNDIVSSAVYMYYKPRFCYDEMPSTTSAKILSIADKLDNITNSFIYNIINGIDNKHQTIDIRRSASGIINIILENKWRLNISNIISDLIYIYVKNSDLIVDYDVLKNEIINFIMEKFREELIKKGFNYKDIDYAIEDNTYDICNAYEKLKIRRN
ncbi:glycine--tRNA ligase subunit beta [Miniphocaeibacter massiliensis]|uniref:glycine--tRNA ligase subunit beta n=1 Tax=Miniphocaeibacter massiliensis TaxID=2041841 RepID=UPI000C082DFD|nr:glycine--tRNA ligase subunit beta [Miniphocaeibacter massiliensis]